MLRMLHRNTAVFDQEFVDVSLDKYKGKYVVLFFYPLDFTFVCPTEITAFSDRHAEFKDIGAEVLGVSVDSQFTHLAWIQTDRKEGEWGLPQCLQAARLEGKRRMRCITHLRVVLAASRTTAMLVVCQRTACWTWAVRCDVASARVCEQLSQGCESCVFVAEQRQLMTVATCT
eukprot:GHRQ01016382.1.p1 GENE.GHRQ01016382.1~~GHRQ01016382.1.p1  ORF type:complete len:173 (-),score=47.02 GHRQ01016382.1:91-609(-)